MVRIIKSQVLRFDFGLIEITRDFASEIGSYPLLADCPKYLFG
jgi:hypothetical protein